MNNKVIIFPTDTVYGIGCSIYSKEAQDKIYKIKNRSHDKPLAVLCANIKQIEEIAYLDDRARTLINEFLPGPVTFILKAKEDIASILGFETIGVRIPDSKLALKILHENGAMTTTSVNESGEKPLDTYEEIYAEYHSLVDEIYKKEEKSSSLSSTVVSIIDDIKILREGAIKKEQIVSLLDSKKMM